MPQPVVHETTARVAAPLKPPLPSLFWGALGCVSVLAIGFTALFVVARPATTPAPRPAAPAPATAVAIPAPPSPLPDIQPLAPPAAAVERPAAHLKPAAHPIKVARAAGSEGVPTRKSERKAQKTASGDETADSTDDSSSAKKASADNAGASADKPADQGAADDDQRVPKHRESASDDPEDE